jgi:hypothetical protein
LGVPDEAVPAATERQAQFGQLRALARSRLTRDDDDLVAAQGVEQLVDTRRDRQLARPPNLELQVGQSPASMSTL